MVFDYIYTLPVVIDNVWWAWLAVKAYNLGLMFFYWHIAVFVFERVSINFRRGQKS